MAKIKPVRIVKTKYGTYSLHYTNPADRRRRLSVSEDYQQAQRLAVRFSDWLLEGKDPEKELQKGQQKEKAMRITIRDFFPVFMQRHGKKRSLAMQRSYGISYRNIMRCPIINTEFGDITKKVVLDYMNARLEQDGVTEATANKDASFLKCMLSRAYEWDIIERNPLQGLKLFSVNSKRDVYLKSNQAVALIKELSTPIANIAEFAIYTGFRKENILSLRIDSVRFHDLTPTGEVELVLKGGRRELFPLSPQAVNVLKQAIGNRREGYVFINPKTGTRYKSIHKTFDRAVRKLNLTISNGTKLRFHDLRHVFATWLHQTGVSLDTLRILLGHKDRATTDRYTSVDRLSTGKVLTLIPQLKNIEQKKNFTYERSEVS